MENSPVSSDPEPSVELRFLDAWLRPKLEAALRAVDHCWKDHEHPEWIAAHVELVECIERIEFLRKLARWQKP